MPVVYTHIRLDNNKVFYVGIGSRARAYDKRRRNKYWYHVVNKHGYRVNITHEDICWDEACSIEKYLIAFYGRSDLKAGTLVNMTDGGEGTVNKSEESKLRQLETAKKNGTYDHMVSRMKYYASVVDKSGINSPVRRDVYSYDVTGHYSGYYHTLTQFCNNTGASIGTASNNMDTGVKVKGYYIFSEYHGTNLAAEKFTIPDLSKRGRSNVRKRPVTLLEKNTGKCIQFDTMSDASKFIGRNKKYISLKVSTECFDFDNYKIILT